MKHKVMSITVQRKDAVTTARYFNNLFANNIPSALAYLVRVIVMSQTGLTISTPAARPDRSLVAYEHPSTFKLL